MSPGTRSDVQHDKDPVLVYFESLVDQARMKFDRRAASLADSLLAEQSDDPIIASVDQSLQSDRVVLEFLRPDAHELKEPLAALIDLPKTWGAGRHYPFGVGGSEPRINGRGGIASGEARLEGLDTSPHDLHVLLRHRPRSISRIRRAVPPQPGGG